MGSNPNVSEFFKFKKVRKQSFSEIPIKILLVFFGAAVAFLFLEGALRLGAVDNRYYRRSRPDGNPDPAASRILILGDSFINQWGAGESVYEKLLEDFRPKGPRFLNTADGGMGPSDYWLQMQIFAKDFRPQIVLLSYYAGNDLTNEQYRRPPSNPVKRLLKPFLVNFYLFHFYNEVEEKLKTRGAAQAAAPLAENRPVNPWLLKLALERPNYILDNVLMETEENRRAWEKVKEILERIDARTKSMGARLAVIVFPHTAQVNRSHFAFFESLGFRIDEGTLSSNRPQALMKEFCEKRKIPCLDLLPDFQASGAGEEFYRENDDHLNEKGSKFAEERIFNFIRALAAQ